MLSTRVTVIALLAATLCLTSGELFYDVACPGVNSELQCPAGQVIKVIQISSGLTSDGDCTNRKIPARVSNDHDLHYGMRHWVRLICDDLERCRLPKPDKKMFMTKNSQDNFVQMVYICRMRLDGVRGAIACQNQIAELICERGLIKVESAKFGRFNENICTTDPISYTFTGSFSAEKRVQLRCDGLKECSVQANSDDMGPTTPSLKISMYLVVEYICT